MYDPKNHINNLISNEYYFNLVKLRNEITQLIDNYFYKLEAPKVDLFMLTRSISSPTGKGSDSLPIKIKLGKSNNYLVDSAQFGMEPIVISGFNMVYCYLPSFRGEENDMEHLTQFYHCEAEMKGNYRECMLIAEKLIKFVISGLLQSLNKKKFIFKKNNLNKVKKIINKPFPVITFDELENIFITKGFPQLIKHRKYGRVLTREGELKASELLGQKNIPVWVIKYDRDSVAFYQKPDKKNLNKVLNADLIFPSINGGFGGEIIGLGERQDNSKQLNESMVRQEIRDKKHYSWYLKLRNHEKYLTTSGFGLGIERFLAWILGAKTIKDVCLYPVLKNEKTYY